MKQESFSSLIVYNFPEELCEFMSIFGDAFPYELRIRSIYSSREDGGSLGRMKWLSTVRSLYRLYPLRLWWIDLLHQDLTQIKG